MIRSIKILLTIATLAILGGCEVVVTPMGDVDLPEQVICSHNATQKVVNYTLHATNGKAEPVRVSAHAHDSWITEIEASEPGTLRLTLEPNHGEKRTTTVEVTAPGYRKASFSVVQLDVPKSMARHTLMYLFLGTSLGSYFKTNIADAGIAIEQGILGSSNRVIYFRQRSTTEAYIAEVLLDTDSGKHMEVVLHDNIIIEGPQLTPEQLGNFISMMANTAPAERYGIIMAGHGHGWIPREVLEGGGATEFYIGSQVYNPWIPALGAEVTRAYGERNVMVNPSEIAMAVEHSQVELDYILFDACFMSNIETIYTLRNCANYIIASPCEIMGKGFPYHRTLPHLFANEGNDTEYAAAAESYYLFYRDEYTYNSRCGSIALYDCSEVEALAETTRQALQGMNMEYDRTKLQTYEGQHEHFFYDFGEWVNCVATDAAALEAFNRQLDKAVVAKFTLPSFYSAYGSVGTYPINTDVYSGVTTSAPSTAYREAWSTTEWYKATMQ